MRLVRRQVEKRLSVMLGAEVTFEKLNLSLLSGTIEAQGVIVSTGRLETPLLSVRRIKAEIAMGAALKKELVVNALTVEKPLIHIVRDANGQLNLPRRAGADAPRQTSDTASDNGANDDDSTSWRFAAKKLLVVDGELHFHDIATGYRALVEPLLADVKQAENGFEFTMIADNARRTDQPADLGSLRLHGHARNMPSPMQWQQARVTASFQAGEMLRGQLDVPSLRPIDAKAQVGGTIDVGHIFRLLPATLPSALAGLNPGAINGRVEINASASFSPAIGLRIGELTIRGADLAVPAV